MSLHAIILKNIEWQSNNMKNDTIRFTKEESAGDSMPTVENVHYEMTDYLNQIKKYIADFKKLPKAEAQKKAHGNQKLISMV